MDDRTILEDTDDDEDDDLYSDPLASSSKTPGAIDLVPQLASLAITKDSYWSPQNPHADVFDIASNENLVELQTSTGCSLSIVEDAKVLIEPSTAGDDRSVEQVKIKLSRIETAMSQQPVLEHILKVDPDDRDPQLTIEGLHTCDDGTFTHTLVPATSWWPDDMTDRTKHLAEAGVMKYHKYSDGRQNWIVVKNVGKSRPTVPQHATNIFQGLQYRTLIPVVPAPAVPINVLPSDGARGINQWISNIQSGSPSISSVSEPSGTGTDPSRLDMSSKSAGTSTSKGLKSPASSVSSAIGDDADMADGLQDVPKKLQENIFPVARAPQTHYLDSPLPQSTTRLPRNEFSTHSFAKTPLSRSALSMSQNGLTGKYTASSNVNGPSLKGKGKFAQNNGFNSLLDMGPETEDGSEAATTKSSLPPGYNMDSPKTTKANDPNVNNQTPLVDVHDGGDDTGFTVVKGSAKQSRKARGKGGDAIIETKEEDPPERRKKMKSSRHRMAGPPPKKKEKKGKALNEALEGLRYDFTTEQPPKPGERIRNDSRPQRAMPQPAKQPACSPKLLSCAKSTFQRARLHRGLVESRMEIGRALMHCDLTETKERMSWGPMKNDHLRNIKDFHTFDQGFSPAITSAWKDIIAISQALGIRSSPLKSDAVWEIVCSSTDKQQVTIVVDAAEGSEVEPFIILQRKLLGATYLHAPQNVHDARWITVGTTKKRIAEVQGAENIVGSLRTTWTNRGNDFSYPTMEGTDSPLLSIIAVRLRTTVRYRIPSSVTANHYVDFVRMIEPKMRRKDPPDNPMESYLFKVMCDDEKALQGKNGLWYEVQIGQIHQPEVLRENEDLELGEEATWKVDDIVDADFEKSQGALEASAMELVGKMANIGIGNRGEAWKMEKRMKEREAKKQVEANLAFTAPPGTLW